MHPAYSVILFTTASGAGYGMLSWLAFAAVLGVRLEPWAAIAGLGMSLVLVALGLISSTFHLGRPERAWRAVSQWRTSWLSREGVLAMLTFVPAGLWGLVLLFSTEPDRAAFVLAICTVPLALATVWCTGMIYQSLPTIRAWRQPIVTPIYVVLALATGAVLLNLLFAVSGSHQSQSAWAGAVLLALAAVLKITYWRMIDTAPRTWTPESATGLGKLGKVRPLDPPHSQPNFVMREMGYSVARKHAKKLRDLTLGLGFALPVVLLLLSIPAGPGFGVLAAVAATIATATGVLIERWLFFAEAQHVVTVYYGADRA
jgi:DMSO reductase anchor subunit